MKELATAKRDLRRRMRDRRVHIGDQPAKSQAICDALLRVAHPTEGDVAMVFVAVPGEPDVSAVASAWRADGIRVVAPEASPTASHPIDPADVDVVLVPGLAFTREGERLGQGGGWYDRFLQNRRSDCLAVGVCYDEQLVADLPVEQHDIGVDLVLTETAVWYTSPEHGPTPRGGTLAEDGDR